MDSNERLQSRLRDLRSEFDQSFAHAHQPPEILGEDFLLIRVAGEPHALRLAEVAALEADRVITPVPSGAAGLLGVAGLRGALVAVFDLAQLLGLAGTSLPGTTAAANSRWLVLVKGTLVAVAFAAFEGQQRLGTEALAAALEAGQRREMLRAAGVTRPIVQLAALAARCEPPAAPAAAVEGR